MKEYAHSIIISYCILLSEASVTVIKSITQNSKLFIIFTFLHDCIEPSEADGPGFLVTIIKSSESDSI